MVIVIDSYFSYHLLIARRGRQNKVVTYNNPPDPQANEAYYNNQYQGGYNNDLPHKLPRIWYQIILKLTARIHISTTTGDYNSGEISRPEGPPQAHTKSY